MQGGTKQNAVNNWGDGQAAEGDQCPLRLEE